MMDATPYLSLSLQIAGVGIALHSFEALATRREYAADGLLDWAALKTTYRRAMEPPLEPLLDGLLSPRLFLPLLLLQGGIGVYLAAFGLGPGALPCVAFSFILLLLFNFRTQSGLDGADQMLLLVHGGALAFLLAPGALGQQAAMGFIAFQSVLSYFTAGLAKARSKVWRSGRAVKGIWSTESYGLPCTARWLSGSLAPSWVLSWFTIIFELAMPLLVFAGRPGALAYIAIGVGFHLVNAVVMGLNGFLWAFLASYPAVYYVAVAWGPLR